MQDHSEGVMIALLPITTDWCEIKLPHMTLVYAGKFTDHPPSDFNEMAKDASSLAAVSKPITIRVTGTEVFGDDERVRVLTLQNTPELAGMRRLVEKWNASKHSEFRPHCTVGTANPLKVYSEMPKYLAFDRVCLQWGDEMLTFAMNR